MNAIYTTPTLCKSANGWFVHIRYNGKQKQFKAGLNRIKCLRTREREANILIQVLKERLASGWSPFGNTVKQKYFLPEAEELQHLDKVFPGLAGRVATMDSPISKNE